MRMARLMVAAASMVTVASVAGGQMNGSETAPPKLLVLVYQRFAFEKAAEIDQWEIGAARACQGLDVPNSWIVMDSVTGEPEALS
ncbi:MAG: hypothetical protein ABSA94_19915, partial [Acidobacteriaceae bacterium]